MSHYQRLKRELVDSRGGHCWKCGEEQAKRLVFHHIGRDRFNVSVELWKIAHNKPGARALSVVKDEAEKCAVLCFVCRGKVRARLLDV